MEETGHCKKILNTFYSAIWHDLMLTEQEVCILHALCTRPTQSARNDGRRKVFFSVSCLCYRLNLLTWLSPGFLLKRLHINLKNWDAIDVARGIQVHPLQLGRGCTQVQYIRHKWIKLLGIWSFLRPICLHISPDGTCREVKEVLGFNIYTAA